MTDSKEPKKGSKLNGIHLERAKILNESVEDLSIGLKKAIKNLRNTVKDCKTTVKLLGDVNDSIIENNSRTNVRKTS